MQYSIIIFYTCNRVHRLLPQYMVRNFGGANLESQKGGWVDGNFVTGIQQKLVPHKKYPSYSTDTTIKYDM